jgi:hypothetical protein
MVVAEKEMLVLQKSGAQTGLMARQEEMRELDGWNE